MHVVSYFFSSSEPVTYVCCSYFVTDFCVDVYIVPIPYLISAFLMLDELRVIFLGAPRLETQ